MRLRSLMGPPGRGSGSLQAKWKPLHFACKQSGLLRDSQEPISKQGLTDLFVSFFLKEEHSVQERSLTKAHLVDSLMNYKHPSGKSFAELVFNRTRLTTRKHIKILLLKLFATKVLTPVVKDLKLHCRLSINDSGDLVLKSHEPWKHIALLEPDPYNVKHY